MMPSHVKTALLAGAVSFLIYLLVFTVGLGFAFMFLPTLPLFRAGFARGSRVARMAAGVASLLTLVVMGVTAMAVYVVLLGWPAAYLCRSCLSGVFNRETNELRWRPVGLAMLDLVQAGCALIAVATFYYWDAPGGGLPALVSASVGEAFADLDPEFAPIRDRMIQWSFLIFPVTVWLWGLLLYAHAWMGHMLAARVVGALRPPLALEPFAMPGWTLGLLAICALASLIGSPSMQLLGKSCLLSLMLPYFFMGLITLRRVSENWPSSGFFMFFVYFMIATQFWPALVLAGVGLWQQIKDLSGAETSSRK